MEFEEHHAECDYLFNKIYRCNCDDLILRDESRLPTGEIIAWAIFIGVMVLLILRILLGIVSISFQH